MPNKGHKLDHVERKHAGLFRHSVNSSTGMLRFARKGAQWEGKSAMVDAMYALPELWSLKCPGPRYLLISLGSVTRGLRMSKHISLYISPQGRCGSRKSPSAISSSPAGKKLCQETAGAFTLSHLAFLISPRDVKAFSMGSTSVLHRPALGQLAQIGTLYDARRDAFLTGSILPHTVPEGGVIGSVAGQVQISTGRVDSVGAKAKLLGLELALAASYVCGLAGCPGFLDYLDDEEQSFAPSTRMFLARYIHEKEKLNLADPALREIADFTMMYQGMPATISSPKSTEARNWIF